MKNKGCWWSEIKEDSERYGIELDRVETIERKEWKKEVKIKIGQSIENATGKREEEMRKLRHQKGERYERKKYVTEVGRTTAAELIRTRLEMWSIGRNLGRKSGNVYMW